MCHFQSSLFTFSVYNLYFISVQTLDGDPHRGSRSTLQLGLSKTLMSFAISSLSPLSDSSTIRRQNPNSWGPSASFFSFFSAPAFFHRSFPSLLYHRLKETTSKAVPAKVTTIGAVAVPGATNGRYRLQTPTPPFLLICFRCSFALVVIVVVVVPGEMIVALPFSCASFPVLFAHRFLPTFPISPFVFSTKRDCIA